MFNYLKNSRQKQFIFLLTIFLILYFFIPKNENSYFWRLPPLLKDLPLMFNILLDNLMFNWFTIPVWDPDWQMYEDKTLFKNNTEFDIDLVIILNRVLSSYISQSGSHIGIVNQLNIRLSKSALNIKGISFNKGGNLHK